MSSELELRKQAWTGDAVLALYARKWILQQKNRIDAELESRMTSNPFLSGLGKPLQVEAQIGRIFASDGLDAAFRWIEENIQPLFNTQENKRLRSSRSSKK